MPHPSAPRGAASYEAHDSMKLASGIHNYILGRGVEDSNTIMVAVKIDDIANRYTTQIKSVLLTKIINNEG